MITEEEARRRIHGQALILEHNANATNRTPDEIIEAMIEALRIIQAELEEKK